MATKPLFVLALIAAALSGASAHASSAEADLVESQKEVIRLQKENLELIKKITKTYDAGPVCFETQSSCTERRDFVNLLSSNSIGVLSNCYKETITDQTSPCFGTKWMLRAKMRIINAE